MKVFGLIAVLLTTSALTPTHVRATEKDDVAQFDRLMSEIRKMLPDGWTVTFDVEKNRYGDSRPMLVVKSASKLPIEYSSSIGRPTAGIDLKPYIVQEEATINFTFVPYMNKESYAAAREKNEQLEQRRRDFEERELRKRQSSFKGGFTPATYQMQTGDRSMPLREYAFLWMNTEPQPLPTHHYGTLSVVTHDLPGTTSVEVIIHDVAKNQQFREIIARLEKLFVPYEVRQ